MLLAETVLKRNDLLAPCKAGRAGKRRIILFYYQNDWLGDEVYGQVGVENTQDNTQDNSMITQDTWDSVACFELVIEHMTGKFGTE